MSLVSEDLHALESLAAQMEQAGQTPLDVLGDLLERRGRLIEGLAHGEGISPETAARLEAVAAGGVRVQAMLLRLRESLRRDLAQTERDLHFAQEMLAGMAPGAGAAGFRIEA